MTTYTHSSAHLISRDNPTTAVTITNTRVTISKKSTLRQVKSKIARQKLLATPRLHHSSPQPKTCFLRSLALQIKTQHRCRRLDCLPKATQNPNSLTTKTTAKASFHSLSRTSNRQQQGSRQIKLSYKATKLTSCHPSRHLQNPPLSKLTLQIKPLLPQKNIRHRTLTSLPKSKS